MKKRILTGWLCLLLLSLCVAQGAFATSGALVSEAPGDQERLEILAKMVQSLDQRRDVLENLVSDENTEDFVLELLDSLSGLRAEDVVLLSPSPDGNGWFGAAGTLPFYYRSDTGEVAAILPDLAGSEENQTYGFTAMLRFFQAPPRSLYDAASFNWSPDGRYIALTSWQMALKMFRGDIDLYLVDTQEGTLRVTRTFEGKNLAQDTASVIQACFSEDSRTLYHTAYGQLEEGRVTVWSQEIDSGALRFLFPAEKTDEDATIYGDLSQLMLLAEGRLLQVMDSAKIHVERGLFVYTADEGGTWIRDEYTLPATVFMPWSVTLSPQSERGLLHFRATTLGHAPAFSVFDTKDGFAGMDQLILLRSFESHRAELLPLDHVMQGGAEVSDAVLAAYSSSLFQVNDASPSVPEEPALYCLAAAIAPTGDQALLLMSDPVSRQLGFLLLNLTSLEATPVDFAWDDALLSDVQASLARDALALHWATNGQLSLSLHNGCLPLGWMDAP